MAEFVKDTDLNWNLASGVEQTDQRSGSVLFDERLVNQGSGIVLKDNGSYARFYACDGSYPMADIYELDVLISGTVQVQTPSFHQLGKVWILDESGQEVVIHQPNKYSSNRNTGVTAAPINGSGTHYLYIELDGRRSCEYDLLVQINDSALGNDAGSTDDLYGGPKK